MDYNKRAMHSPKEFKDYMRQKLPLQVVMYLTACGFDSEQAFVTFDDSGSESDSMKQIVDMLQNHNPIIKQNNPANAEIMYGIFYKCPESFCILPGHRSQIQSFVREVKRLVRNHNKINVRLLESASKSGRSGYSRRSHFPSPYSCRSSSSLWSSSTFESTGGSNAADNKPKISVTEIPIILKHLKETVTTYLRDNDDLKHMADGKHYSVHISPAVISCRDGSYPISACITCYICGTRLQLPVIRSKFRPANFYRHVKSCILKKIRREKDVEEDQKQVKVTSVLQSGTKPYISLQGSVQYKDRSGRIVRGLRIESVGEAEEENVQNDENDAACLVYDYSYDASSHSRSLGSSTVIGDSDVGDWNGNNLGTADTNSEESSINQ